MATAVRAPLGAEEPSSVQTYVPPSPRGGRPPIKAAATRVRRPSPDKTDARSAWAVDGDRKTRYATGATPRANG